MSRNKNQSSNTSNKSNLNDSGNLDLDSELEKTHIHEDAEEVHLDDQTRLQLRKEINTWVLSDDKIRILNKETKKFKNIKKESEQQVIEILSRANNNEIKTQSGEMIRKAVSRTKTPLKPNKKSLMEIYQDETNANNILQKILDKRGISERVYLKRTKPREKSDKK
jgi:hypothetical protein